MSGMFLSNFRRLHAISADDLAALAGVAEPLFVSPAESIVARCDDELAAATVLLQGVVRRTKARRDGSRQILAVHFAGDVIDLWPVAGHRYDTIEAVTVCKGVRLPYPALRALLSERPHLIDAFGEDARLNARIADERLVSLGRRTALERLAHLFCEIACRMDAVGLGAGGRYEMPLTQAEIGDLLGLSVVHVNRTLQQLRSTGALTLRSRRLVVHDFELLRKIGEFDASYLGFTVEAPAPSLAVA
ncbi:MAG TPA: Crp/Fnr family transcriptional regulator [Phenylobacterium sp.]